ncbi:MAG TPA: NAD(P)/FAD-dependent oxidoreductase [Acidimicrobiales bacterium]|nr:NAD(P)/FAD-dependent oxidoreductase [Acidimicrobiales bacterium]
MSETRTPATLMRTAPHYLSAEPEHFDVVVVGAGLSGIGAACHLSNACPGKSFVILEARASMGGTWDLFRYPGIRSDSDMFTLGYSFNPWTELKTLADGPSILGYIRETAAAYGLDRHIRYRQRVVKASWSTPRARWHLEVADETTGRSSELTCSFLYLNCGYYRYDAGYVPELPEADRFEGTIVHPQHWPEDLDYENKRVVVIGSGATAVTLVPAMAEKAAHVTMLQRSPSYVASVPTLDPFAALLRRHLPARAVYPLVRWKNILAAIVLYQICQRAPRFMRRVLRKGVAKSLPSSYDVDTHFNPRYDPWDQRMCFVPDSDLFEAIRAEAVSVVTDEIEAFTEHGLRLASGGELEAEVVVTATGLNFQLLGGIELDVDGHAVDLSATFSYKGIMFTGLPNLASTFGYTNASWTLKADLGARYVCRLLKFMEEQGYDLAIPRAPDPGMGTEPFIGLTSGYVRRSLDRLPKQATRTPWRLHQNYLLDLRLLRGRQVDDGTIELSRAVAAPADVAVAAPADVAAPAT